MRPTRGKTLLRRPIEFLWTWTTCWLPIGETRSARSSHGSATSRCNGSSAIAANKKPSLAAIRLTDENEDFLSSISDREALRRDEEFADELFAEIMQDPFAEVAP